MSDRLGWEVVARPPHLPQRGVLGEGPLWDAQADCLWWVDIVGRRIHRLDAASGEVRDWDAGAHISAAIPCESGGLVIAAPDGLHRFSLASGLATPFARPDPDGENRSNECRVDPQGRLWLGTMSNNLTPEGEPRALRGATGGLFRVEADGACAQALAGIGISNTLAWTPEGDRLCFADSLEGVIWSFRFDPERPVLEDRRVLLAPGGAAGAPDGSAMDEAGCLWNARWDGGRIVRITPDGRVDLEIEIPAHQPTCVAFGDSDRRTLYVTSARERPGLAPDSLDGCLFTRRVETPGSATRRFAG